MNAVSGTKAPFKFNSFASHNNSMLFHPNEMSESSAAPNDLFRAFKHSKMIFSLALFDGFQEGFD